MTCLVVDANCEYLWSDIVTADHAMVLRNRLVRGYPEFGDSTEGGLRALERTYQGIKSHRTTRPAYAFGKSHIFVNWARTIEKVVTSCAFSVITLAHKADVLNKSMRVAF